MTDSTRDIHPITDSHCHLDFPDFDGELPDVIARAQAAGVTRMVTICTKLKNEPAVRAIAEAHAPVFYAAGTHPMSVATEPMASYDDLMALTKHPKMVGIGETGLDYHYTADSAEAQQASLRTHIAASRDSGLPLIIHARDADDDMARILREEHANGAYPCVMHCFSSTQALGRAAAECKEQWEIRPGAHYSMGGIRVDEFGSAVSIESRDRVEGLFAAGQAMGGVFGANRLGSTSLSEGPIFGTRAGRAAAA
ncbi:TatD family hydrolase, partial [uncultured Sulfitobacter sp.]|uniref:TatD family hydrolase n=1 Tax=uncultured Sulfitobacter sp. TaxID=191468 RepID=UPI002597A34F